VSITTYTELKSAVADFLNRQDLASAIPTFISLAESSFNRDIRHWRMDVRISITLDAQFVDLPSGWLETVKIVNATGEGPQELELIPLAEMDERRFASNNTAGAPRFYAINGGKIELYPTPSEAFTASITYVQKPTALSTSNASNWLLENFPDVYLYGSLAHSAPYLQEDSRLGVWAALYQQALSAINLDSDRAKYSGTGLRMKLRAF
jgi:hypothetical protein